MGIKSGRYAKQYTYQSSYISSYTYPPLSFTRLISLHFTSTSASLLTALISITTSQTLKAFIILSYTYLLLMQTYDTGKYEWYQWSASNIEPCSLYVSLFMRMLVEKPLYKPSISAACAGIYPSIPSSECKVNNYSSCCCVTEEVAELFYLVAVPQMIGITSISPSLPSLPLPPQKSDL